MIRIENLTIKYGELVAVDDVSLQVGKGSVFGLVGPNGAGKTSMIRALAGLLMPAKGRCFIADIDVHENPIQARRLIGYMPDFFGLYDHLTVREYLELFGQLHGLRGKKLRERIDYVIELTELEIKTDQYISGLSRGMRQRLCFARAILHDPPVYLLDEPASGVDPRGRYQIRQTIRKLGDQGKTVFVSSHILPELSDICDSIGIIERGKLVAAGTVESIAEKLGRYRVLSMRILDGLAEKVREALADMPAVASVDVVEEQVEVQVADDDNVVAEVISRLVNAGLRIGAISERRIDLEKLYMELTRGELA